MRKMRGERESSSGGSWWWCWSSTAVATYFCGLFQDLYRGLGVKSVTNNLPLQLYISFSSVLSDKKGEWCEEKKKKGGFWKGAPIGQKMLCLESSQSSLSNFSLGGN